MVRHLIHQRKRKKRSHWKEVWVNKLRKGSNEPVTWFKPTRRLSYSEILEERFISTFDDHEDLPKKKCEGFVKKGQIIEEKHENVAYLLKKEVPKETGDQTHLKFY